MIHAHACSVFRGAHRQTCCRFDRLPDCASPLAEVNGQKLSQRPVVRDTYTRPVRQNPTLLFPAVAPGRCWAQPQRHVHVTPKTSCNPTWVTRRGEVPSERGFCVKRCSEGTDRPTLPTETGGKTLLSLNSQWALVIFLSLMRCNQASYLSAKP